VVGTGKSTVAARLSEQLDAVVVASDRVRKRLFGVADGERIGAGWGRGAYAPEQVERTYAAILERARPVLGSGRPAILDATFSKRTQRDAARRLAGELGCDAFLVEVGCAPEVALERLARRRAAGTDPSDAGPETFAPSVRAFEAPQEWPGSRRLRIATDAPDWSDALARLGERIGRR
jgi:predicted kinase